MSTKIRAILFRKWEKTDKQGKTIIKAKGRDYYDLMWYLEKGVQPNLACLEKFEDFQKLKQQLVKIIDELDAKSIQLDLEAFIDNQELVRSLGENMKAILKRDIEEKIY